MVVGSLEALGNNGPALLDEGWKWGRQINKYLHAWEDGFGGRGWGNRQAGEAVDCIIWTEIS